jgi:hypothetical protein
MLKFMEVKFTPEQEELLKEIADREGIDLAGWVKGVFLRLIDEAKDRKLELAPEAEAIRIAEDQGGVRRSAES